MRRSFEEKLRTFSQAQAQFEQEKRAALEELKAEHRQEIQEILRSHQSQNANYSKDQEKLGQLHKAEVTSAQVERLLKAQVTRRRRWKESRTSVVLKLFLGKPLLYFHVLSILHSTPHTFKSQKRFSPS